MEPHLDQRVPASTARAVECNLGWRLMRAGLTCDPNRPALLYGDTSVSYAELERWATDTADLLRSRGVRTGDRVGLLFPNHPAFVAALLATLRAGAVAVPLNVRAGERSLSHAVSDARPVLVLAHDSLIGLAGAVGATSLADTLAIGEDTVWHDLDGQRLAPPPDAPSPTTPVGLDDVCLQPYTSGSTGRPKGCLLTHGGQLWNVEATRRAWQLRSRERALVAAPLYHKNAMICVLKPCLLAGATVAIARDPDPTAIPAEIARHRCTYATGVPATYEMLLASGEHERHDLSSLRFVICGSAPLGPDLATRIERGLRAPVIECYGLTEGGPLVLANRLAGPRIPGSAGRPLEGVEVAVVDGSSETDDPVDAGVGRTGELWVRNPGVLAGYAGLPEQTSAKVTPTGWLRTGDAVRRDAAGNVFILGRRDEMMSVGGENVYPAEVERLLRSAAGVSQAAVVAVPHAVKGQVPVAFVVGGGGGPAVEEERLKRHCLVHGAAYAHPRRIWSLDALPLAGTGKVDRQALAELAARRVGGEIS